MFWTKEKPTETGWYYHRKGRARIYTIIEVIRGCRGEASLIYAPYPGAEYVSVDRGLWWAGPIPKPEEPVEAEMPDIAVGSKWRRKKNHVTVRITNLVTAKNGDIRDVRYRRCDNNKERACYPAVFFARYEPVKEEKPNDTRN